MRAKSGAAFGPTREIHAGSGYWSQDGAVTVLSGDAAEIWVRWPGGAVTTVPVPPGAKEVNSKFITN